MGNFLNEEDVKDGEIIPIYLSDKLEGYAFLVESAGEPLSFSEENSEGIYHRQRWLIEWCPIETIETPLSRELLWTQRCLAGKRTHRKIIFKVADSWEEYVEIFGNPRESKGDDRKYVLKDNSELF